MSYEFESHARLSDFYIKVLNLDFFILSKARIKVLAECEVLIFPKQKDALVAATYFREKTHYHRPWSISLLCSEWEEVGQLQYNRHQSVFFIIITNY